MAKAKVKLTEVEKLLKEASVRVNRLVYQETGYLIVKMMKDRIAKGLSPIEQQGRFPGYKDPKKYPAKVKGKFPSKRTRPVNLYLSGLFLSKLTSRVSPAKGQITIGFFDSYGRKLEQGHREGANGQPSRPIIPESSEALAKSIRLAILKLYEQAVRKYLSSRK